jgi:hypothetical protein
MIPAAIIGLALAVLGWAFLKAWQLVLVIESDDEFSHYSERL